MKTLEVEFVKIVGEGKTLGRKNGKVVFSYGVLPSELALIKVVREKRNFIEGEVLEIKTKSEFRVEPLEDHYLSCSCWQIIKYEKQIEYKKKLIEDLFFQTTKENIQLNYFYSANELFEYRTKIEYSFKDENEDIYLAFHKRGDYSTKLKLPYGCKLISNKANEFALKILDDIRKSNISLNLLKTFVIRRSKRYNSMVFVLYVKDPDVNFEPSCIEDYGFVLVYSNPIASISQVDGIIDKKGYDYVKERVLNMDFEYGFDCFFQNNIELFEKAITEIKESCGGNKNILDLYCGVGVIGLLMSDISKKVKLVEANPSSVEYVKRNIINNDIRNADVFNITGEKLDISFFEDLDLLILDPPRAGLCKNVIKNILISLPPKIAYLSCNPITQGRDLNFLMEKYKIRKVVGFDFYPNTPHMESLVILERK